MVVVVRGRRLRLTRQFRWWLWAALASVHRTVFLVHLADAVLQQHLRLPQGVEERRAVRVHIGSRRRCLLTHCTQGKSSHDGEFTERVSGDSRQVGPCTLSEKVMVQGCGAFICTICASSHRLVHVPTETYEYADTCESLRRCTTRPHSTKCGTYVGLFRKLIPVREERQQRAHGIRYVQHL